MSAVLTEAPTREQIAAGAEALIEYDLNSRKYDSYSHKAAAEAVLWAVLELRESVS